MTPVPPDVTVNEEFQRFCNNLNQSIKPIREFIIGTREDECKVADDLMDELESRKLFADADDEGWTCVVAETSRDVPEENHEESYRLSQGQGPIQQAAAHAQQKAIEAALEAVGVTGQTLKAFMENVAEDSGWLLHCNSVDEAMRRLMSQLPVLRGVLQGAGPVLEDLKTSFARGREMARGQRVERLSSESTGGLETHSARVRQGGLAEAEREKMAKMGWEESTVGKQ